MPDDPQDQQPHFIARTAGTLVLACVAAVAALYFGRDFLVPIAFAVLLTALFRPVVRGLQHVRVPAPAGAAAVVLGLMVLMAVAGVGLAGPVQNWIAAAPQRFAAAQERFEKLRRPVRQVTEVANRIEQAAQGPTSNPSASAAAAPSSAAPPAGLVSRLFGTTTKFVSGLIEVLLLLFLLLATGDLFPRKIVKVMPTPERQAAAEQALDKAESVVLRYLWVTFLINLGQGALVAGVMWLLKMPSPLLWGLATVVLEFVPYLGAAVMVGTLSVIAFATFDHMGHVLAVPGSYLAITTVQNNVVSPLAYGHGLKLNPVAVLLGVLFWWYVWGIPGAFMAVPIVAAIKIAADHGRGGAKVVGEFLGE